MFIIKFEIQMIMQIKDNIDIASLLTSAANMVYTTGSDMVLMLLFLVILFVIR